MASDWKVDDTYDPEKALWKPGRRSFLFMFGAALAAPMLPALPIPQNTLISSLEVTRVVAEGYRQHMRFMNVGESGGRIIKVRMPIRFQA